MADTIDEGDVSFTPMEAGDLAGSITVVPQALDNQWFDRRLLAEVMRAGEVTGAVHRERSRKARTEYLRAVLGAERVVVNRAYLYNNPEVYSDYLRDGPDREAFRDLLQDGVIVPYLLHEPSPLPAEPPSFQVAEGFRAWREVAEQTPMSCLRLSWDEKENAELARNVAKEFNAFVNNLTQLEPEALKRDLDLDDMEHARSVLRRLRVVGRWVHDELDADRLVIRQGLYERFVVVDGTNVADRRYDPGKPHAAEVKQLIDLKYAANLADAVDVFCLTPADSPRRTALQEGLAALRGRGRDELPGTDADQLLTLLRNLAFEDVQRLLESVPTLDRLSLADIRSTRREKEWRDYRDALARLMNSRSVEAFADHDTGARAITRAYLEMLRKAEQISARRRTGEAADRYSGVTEIGIDIGALTITLLYSPESAGPAVEVVGTAAGLTAARATRVGIRWGVGRLLGRGTRRRIETTVKLLDLRMDNPAREARTLIDRLANRPTAEPGDGNGQDMSDEA
ncbi:hypothetical protein [Thermomonospora amylolytica]|uniref:hypothetical protein n=1 Tax=Thermomonospora amylolytica TaxID=1411117 RepID=UPI001300A99E|nr:hypothetical protein [Thermomonospora amylolytica]